MSTTYHRFRRRLVFRVSRCCEWYCALCTMQAGRLGHIANGLDFPEHSKGLEAEWESITMQSAIPIRNPHAAPKTSLCPIQNAALAPASTAFLTNPCPHARVCEHRGRCRQRRWCRLRPRPCLARHTLYMILSHCSNNIDSSGRSLQQADRHQYTIKRTTQVKMTGSVAW